MSTLSIPALLAEAVARHGERVLIVADGERLTCAEADRRSAELARGLVADGIVKGERVALLLPNGVDWVVCFLALARVGAVVVPCNTFWQGPELAWALRHADAARLFTAPAFRGHDYLERLEEALPGLAESRGERPLALPSHPYLRQIRVSVAAQRGWLRGSVADLVAAGGSDGVVGRDAHREQALVVDLVGAGGGGAAGRDAHGGQALVADLAVAGGGVVGRDVHDDQKRVDELVVTESRGDLGGGQATPTDLLAAIESEVSAADWLAIVYSSGSTAHPKGVVHSHGAVVRQARAMAAVYELGPGERLYSPMPFFWVGGFVVSMLGQLASGATLLTHGAFEPGPTLDLLESERATVVIGWPHFARAMLEHPSFARRDLSSIARGSLLDLLPAALRPRDPGLRSNSLGMTETCGPHAAAPVGTGELPERLRGAFGRALPDVEHRIVDAETRAPLPAGSIGEIAVRGPSLMQGLYKREREEVFLPDGFYATGDGGHLSEDGWLFFAGRLGEIIKTGGANVSPAEGEAALRELPGVAQAWVAGIPDAGRGERVAAAIVPARGAELDPSAVRLALRQRLSSYKIPETIRVCTAEELPFTDSGKIRRADLAALLATGARGGA